MSGRIGEWTATFSGKQFWPLDPREDEIDIVDIAHHLALQCRFGGACRSFYSVGEHSVRVSRVVPPEDALDGLLHDAAEAYLVDLPRPIKRASAMGRLYEEIEDRLARVIRRKFGLREELPTSVCAADNVLLPTEKRDLLGPAPAPWHEAQAANATAEPLVARICPWTPQTAESAFLYRFRELTGEIEEPAPIGAKFEEEEAL